MGLKNTLHKWVVIHFSCLIIPTSTLLFAKFFAEVFISNLCPPRPNFNKKERRILQLRQTQRLELIVRPYLESSYLLASDTPAWRQAHSQLVVVQNCMAQFSDRTHSVSSLINDPLPCRTEPLWASLQATREGDGQFHHCYFPHVLYSEKRGHINQTNYHYPITSPPPYM